ncbi:MAG TPA: hypothetical protein VK611_25950 [Acidimicrobiales bacterium]|nr:hypothetical protein [Acidimicrobiales bacterium]
MTDHTLHTLADAIERLDIPTDARALAQCFDLLDRFSLKLTSTARERVRAEMSAASGRSP